jgi:hypothetical protein
VDDETRGIWPIVQQSKNYLGSIYDPLSLVADSVVLLRLTTHHCSQSCCNHVWVMLAVLVTLLGQRLVRSKGDEQLCRYANRQNALGIDADLYL